MGLPSLQALVGGGGGVVAFVTHFQEGLENYLGRGGGLNSGVWEGVLFFVSQVVFIGFFFYIRLTNCNFKLQVCHVVQCCGVLWSRKV